MKTNSSRLLPGLLLLLVLPGGAPAASPSKDRWWSAEVERALARAGTNRAEMVKALKAVPPPQRKGMAFLLVNMPARDLRSLRGDFLLENVALAYKARGQVPWGRRLPEAIFLNDILPYANVDEERHPWRKQLHDLCLPLVKNCKTPSEAAQLLNATLFRKLQVRFSTRRKKPHQSPKETIATRMASCTGLSILLSDACRSVAVPARLAGTPLWSNKRGNHTWVEVWDKRWHFTGAAEADPKGLDRAWFAQDASRAKKGSRAHAIYAASFRKTGLIFPLVWAPEQKDVHAENVTDRYTRSAKPAQNELSKEQLRQVEKAARSYFTASEAERAKWKPDAKLDQLLAGHEEAMRRALWAVYRSAPIHADMKKDFEQKRVRSGKHLSPYTVKKVGRRPKGGWPLFIAMHGGGGVPKAINDSQWRIMQRYYRDQASVTGYQYLALRAPNDVWNGFYDNNVPPLVVNLIRQFLLFGDVDSNRVYLMGYSHGGYGAFFIGPKIPDRFAAIHSSAAAPTGGTVSPRTLRNTRFTYMIGERDNAYGRRKLCEAFDEAVRKLRQQNKGAYPVQMELKKGYGHGGLPDRDKIKEMYAFRRNPVPRHVTWELTDPVIRHFFWLSVPRAGQGQNIDARIGDNAVQITTSNVKQFDLELDGRLITFDKPLRIILNGKTRLLKVQPSFRTLCQSLRERGDPALAFSCRLSLPDGK